MKVKINLYSILTGIIILSCIVIFLNCNKESVVQPQNNNNQNPTQPVLVSPNNETSARSLAPILSWQKFPAAVSYEIQVSLDANMAGTMILDTSGVTDTLLHVAYGKLTTNIYYYWRVKATISGGNNSNWSLIWRFNIILNAPQPPILQSPSNNSTGQSYTPLFNWNSLDSVQYYRIQVSQNPNFSPILFDSNRIVIPQLQLPVFYLNSGTQYFWRANASNSNGVSTSQWSTVFNFTTLAGPQPNSISGTITFVDTNFVHYPQHYILLVTSTWPPISVTSQSDSLSIVKNGGVYQAAYIVTRLYNGNYYLSVITQGSEVPTLSVMGIYGCDTVHVNYSSCPNNPSTVQITENHGLANINFLSWADTSKKIF